MFFGDYETFDSNEIIKNYFSSFYNFLNWYCKQCGYICYREEPPYLCPICKANRELFAEITQS